MTTNSSTIDTKSQMNVVPVVASNPLYKEKSNLLQNKPMNKCFFAESTNIKQENASGNNDRVNTGITTEIDNLFKNLLFKMKTEKPQIRTLKGNILKRLNNVNKLKIDSDVEINNINPNIITKQTSIKQTNTDIGKCL
jgi:hypothetical protein